VPAERIGDTVEVETADHPPRTDSAEYVKTRRWLQQTGQGCIVCGGKPIQDHHGGGITIAGSLVALNLFPLEWSQGWGANPRVVAGHVAALNIVLSRLGEATYDDPIRTVDEVMAWVDSPHNASVPLCAAHHTGHETSHTPDAQGHEAVGIHNIPLPIWAGQVTCDWDAFDMWGGSTGTLAVAPAPGGEVKVLHVAATHPDAALYAAHQRALLTGDEHLLPAHHIHARAGHAGAHRDAA
jgi:hypothetical protein